MKHLILAALAIISLMSCKSQEVGIMTYNIRLNTPTDGENAWPVRANFLTSQVLFHSPDIMGVQEALPDQIAYLQNALENYDYIGKGRDENATGEHTAIYYNKTRFKVEKSHTFWLSKTPDVVSKNWDAALPRICTYGLFTHLKSKKKVWVFNTHLDHVGAVSRLESMKLILQKIQEVNTNDTPVVLMGDFNVTPDSELITMLKNDLYDAKEIAKYVYGTNGTFNGFNYNEPVTRRIDFIMLSKTSAITVENYGVLSDAIDFKFPSDHFPVFIKTMLN